MAHSKVFVHLFQKVAGSKGGALGRHPQMAERPMLQAHLGGLGGFCKRKSPQDLPFLCPLCGRGPPHGGGGAKRRWGPYLAGGAFSPGEGLPRLSANASPFRGGGAKRQRGPTWPVGLFLLGRACLAFLPILPLTGGRWPVSLPHDLPHGGAGAGRGGCLFYGEVGGNGAVCAPMAALRQCVAERLGR